MRVFSIVIIMLLSNVVYGYDAYEDKSNAVWNTRTNLSSNVVVKSIDTLTRKQIKLIRDVYDTAVEKFYTHYGVGKCKVAKLDVRVIYEEELNSEIFFPNEYHSTESGKFIFGRFYRDSNVLYIIHMEQAEYHWKKYFAHELLHYFYNECNIKFRNNKDEHKEMEKFLYKYGNLFY